MIDSKTYILPKDNYVRTSKKKSQIVVGNTFSEGMNHYIGWLKRHNGKYKKTAAFTISRNGLIYQHYNPKYYSEFIGINKYDEITITIVLENVGWLNEINEDLFTITGKQYNDLTTIRNWRKHTYWSNYTDEQMTSLLDLSKYLCEKFNIPLQTIGHNTKVEDIYDYKGITFRSNYTKLCTDINPTWDYELFKEKLENYER